jgi:hypothetical protein
MPEQPRTEAGRRIWQEKPIGWTGQDWRAAILAIEREAAGTEALRAALAQISEIAKAFDISMGGQETFHALAPPRVKQVRDIARAALASTPSTPEAGLMEKRAIVNALRSTCENGMDAGNDGVVIEDFDWYQEQFAAVGWTLARLTEADR